MIKPHALKKGSTIGIVAPSSPFSEKRFIIGVDILKSMGFLVKYNEAIFKKNNYLAGTDDERACELNLMLSDPDVDAVMFARGGYGVQRVMPQLDLSEFRNRPKLIVGYSDLTTLLSYVSSTLGVACLYGPVVAGLADSDDRTLLSLENALTSTEPLKMESKNLKVIGSGEAEGRLLGGCLSLLTSSVGTEYCIKGKGAILFIEDHGEKVYRYDRMLTQLKNAGILKMFSGIIFGAMGLVEEESDSKEYLWKMIGELLHDFKGPIVYGLSSGHILPFITLPLGVKCSLVASERGSSFEIKEGALI